jgi:hypothetical protein
MELHYELLANNVAEFGMISSIFGIKIIYSSIMPAANGGDDAKCSGCGIGAQAYFRRAFSKKTVMAPSEHRKKHGL